MESHTKNLPQCLGFIMDGNRRWAAEQGYDTVEGHQYGREVFGNVVRWVRDAGVAHAVFFAFSTENWQRSEREVSFLMDLFREWLSELDRRLEEDGVRVRIIGRRQDFAEDIQVKMNELEQKSEEYTKTTIWVALSYGGRAEILAGVNKAIAAGEPVDESSFTKLLWSADLPEIDMIVRTSGEQRTSGFMTWHGVYSELYFIDKHWPALEKSDFDAILAEYANRERRRGK
jgi:undecaprenyl diphosphate synthase